MCTFSKVKFKTQANKWKLKNYLSPDKAPDPCSLDYLLFLSSKQNLGSLQQTQARVFFLSETGSLTKTNRGPLFTNLSQFTRPYQNRALPKNCFESAAKLSKICYVVSPEGWYPSLFGKKMPLRMINTASKGDDTATQPSSSATAYTREPWPSP